MLISPSAVFGGALAAATPETPKLAVAFGTIAGFGVGGVLVPSATVALVCVPDEFLATTAALSLSIRTIGGSIGYTIYYNIFSNKITSLLPEVVTRYASEAGLQPADAAEFVKTFLTTSENITGATGYSPAILEAATLGSKWAYAESLEYVWYSSIAFGILSIIACVLLPSIKKYQTNRVAVAL